MVLAPILMDINQETRLQWKTSGLFSKKETRKEVKDEVLKDFQQNLDDCLAADLNYNLLLPMPYAEIPQHIQTNAEQDIPKPTVLDEAEWDLGSFDVENNIHCEIFSELSDLLTTGCTDEVPGPKSETPSCVSKPSNQVAGSTNNSVSESPSSMPVARRVVANHFTDHNYAAVVPEKSPATYRAIENTCAATSERDVGQNELLKTMKYVERRKKNNMASRRSRETRKRKCAEMEEQVFRLEQKNAELRNRITKMEWLSCTMKRALFGKVDDE